MGVVLPVALRRLAEHLKVLANLMNHGRISVPSREELLEVPDRAPRISIFLFKISQRIMDKRHMRSHPQGRVERFASLNKLTGLLIDRPLNRRNGFLGAVFCLDSGRSLARTPFYLIFRE